MLSKKIVLRFPRNLTSQPVTYKLIKDYNLIVNILKAQIKEGEEGLMVIELSGENENFDKGISYLKQLNVDVQPLDKEIIRHEDICTHCSACISHCPTKALYIKDRKTMEVGFEPEKCIACEACVLVCPFRAMKVEF